MRSICRLRPGVPGLSDNIRIIRLVDRFLEHARVWVFHHNGAEKMYMGSADWMERNLSHRIETVFPVRNAAIKAEIMHMLRLQLADNQKAVELDAEGQNQPRKLPVKPVLQAQLATYELIRQNELGKLPAPEIVS